MAEREIIIINRLGLHARAASQFVNLAKTFASSVELVNGETRVDGKRIMSVMLLGAGQNTRLTLCTDGDDADQAMAALCELIDDRFGEGE
jgi:phosphocarrier protein HPr